VVCTEKEQAMTPAYPRAVFAGIESFLGDAKEKA